MDSINELWYGNISPFEQCTHFRTSTNFNCISLQCFVLHCTTFGKCMKKATNRMSITKNLKRDV